MILCCLRQNLLDELYQNAHFSVHRYVTNVANAKLDKRLFKMYDLNHAMCM